MFTPSALTRRFKLLADYVFPGYSLEKTPEHHALVHASASSTIQADNHTQQETANNLAALSTNNQQDQFHQEMPVIEAESLRHDEPITAQLVLNEMAAATKRVLQWAYQNPGAAFTIATLLISGVGKAFAATNNAPTIRWENGNADDIANLQNPYFSNQMLSINDATLLDVKSFQSEIGFLFKKTFRNENYDAYQQVYFQPYDTNGFPLADTVFIANITYSYYSGPYFKFEYSNQENIFVFVNNFSQNTTVFSVDVKNREIGKPSKISGENTGLNTVKIFKNDRAVVNTDLLIPYTAGRGTLQMTVYDTKNWQPIASRNLTQGYELDSAIACTENQCTTFFHNKHEQFKHYREVSGISFDENGQLINQFKVFNTDGTWNAEDRIYASILNSETALVTYSIFNDLAEWQSRISQVNVNTGVVESTYILPAPIAPTFYGATQVQILSSHPFGPGTMIVNRIREERSNNYVIAEQIFSYFVNPLFNLTSPSFPTSPNYNDTTHSGIFYHYFFSTSLENGMTVIAWNAPYSADNVYTGKENILFNIINPNSPLTTGSTTASITTDASTTATTSVITTATTGTTDASTTATTAHATTTSMTSSTTAVITGTSSSTTSPITTAEMTSSTTAVITTATTSTSGTTATPATSSTTGRAISTSSSTGTFITTATTSQENGVTTDATIMDVSSNPSNAAQIGAIVGGSVITVIAIGAVAKHLFFGNKLPRRNYVELKENRPTTTANTSTLQEEDLENGESTVSTSPLNLSN